MNKRHKLMLIQFSVGLAVVAVALIWMFYSAINIADTPLTYTLKFQTFWKPCLLALIGSLIVYTCRNYLNE